MRKVKICVIGKFLDMVIWYRCLNIPDLKVTGLLSMTLSMLTTAVTPRAGKIIKNIFLLYLSVFYHNIINVEFR